jgi:hypothetical protein
MERKTRFVRKSTHQTRPGVDPFVGGFWQMTAQDLENLFGKTIEPKELAAFLRLDVRTVKKYADRWGGVEVAPGKIRFFEKPVLEVLHAEFGQQTRNRTVSCKRCGPRHGPAKALPGRHQKVLPGGHRMGERDPEAAGGGTIPDRFGIFAGRNLGK